MIDWARPLVFVHRTGCKRPCRFLGKLNHPSHPRCIAVEEGPGFEYSHDVTEDGHIGGVEDFQHVRNEDH